MNKFQLDESDIEKKSLSETTESEVKRKGEKEGKSEGKRCEEC